MSEIVTRQIPNAPQGAADNSRMSKLADGLLAVALLTTGAAVTVGWIVALYWIAGAFFSDG